MKANPFGVVGDLSPAVLHRLREPTSPEDAIERLHSDALFFITLLWHDRGLHRKAPLSWFELDAADFVANGPNRRGILGFRGIGKTHFGTSVLTCFRLRRDRNRKVFIVSRSKPSATETVGFIREWLGSVWFLKDLCPQRGDIDNKTAFNVAGCQEARQPSVKAEGIEGQTEGNRAHTLIPDDCETKDNTKTVESRAELRRRVKEFKNIVYPDQKDPEWSDFLDKPIDPPEIVYIGTPKTEDSLYLEVINWDYRFQSYPIAGPSPSERVIALAPSIQSRLDAGTLQPGEPTCPHRFGRPEVNERRAEGYSEFARESMLIADLANSNRYPLRLSDLIILPVPPRQAPITVSWGTRDHNGSTALPIPTIGIVDERLHAPIAVDEVVAPFLGTKVWIDPAGRGDDETGYASISYLNGYLWLRRVLGLPGGHTEADMDLLIAAARNDGAQEIYIESNADTLGTYRQLFRSRLQVHFIEPGDALFPAGWKCALIDDPKICHSTGQKETRIIGAIEPVLSSHRLIADPATVTPTPGLPINLELQYQLARITRDRKCLPQDGKIDCIAGCIRAWNYALSIDPLRHRKNIEESAIDTQIADFHAMLGVEKPRRAPSWIRR